MNKEHVVLTLLQKDVRKLSHKNVLHPRSNQRVDSLHLLPFSRVLSTAEPPSQDRARAIL